VGDEDVVNVPPAPLRRPYAPTMSFTGLAPPPFFFSTPGRQSLPWEQWEPMFNVYLLASGAAAFKPEQRKAILLHCLGTEGQHIYQTLHAGTSAAAPAAPSAAARADDKSVVAPPDEYDSALAALRHQFSTSRNVIIERHRFHRRSQHTGESVHDFVAALRELASHCSFASQDDALRDQFVADVASTRVREWLLLEGSTLSFENSVRIALQFEQAAEELKELSASVDAISLRQRRKPSSHASKKRNSQPAATLEQNLTRSAGGSRAPQRSRPPERNQEQSSRSGSSHCLRYGSRNHIASAPQCPAQEVILELKKPDGRAASAKFREGHASVEDVHRVLKGEVDIPELPVVVPFIDAGNSIVVVQPVFYSLESITVK
ncbi:uncharacterized protein, partial [Dermacentor andersoni]|uniref:uncharacterized protein n=1 Tax=Dermacentor andersoni TaxID=34620 RepID=UPI003B3A0987